MVALLHSACPDYFPAHALDHLRAGTDEGRSESVKGMLYQAGWGGEAASGASGLWNVVPGRIMLKFGIAPVRAAGVFLVVYRSRLCTSLVERASLVIYSKAFALRKGLTRAKHTLRFAPLPGLQRYTSPVPPPEVPPPTSGGAVAPAAAADGAASASGGSAEEHAPGISGLERGDVEVVTLGTAASVPGVYVIRLRLLGNMVI